MLLRAQPGGSGGKGKIWEKPLSLLKLKINKK